MEVYQFVCTSMNKHYN